MLDATNHFEAKELERSIARLKTAFKIYGRTCMIMSVVTVFVTLMSTRLTSGHIITVAVNFGTGLITLVYGIAWCVQEFKLRKLLQRS